MTDRSWEAVHPLRNDPKAPFFSWNPYGVHVEPELILRQDPGQAFPLKVYIKRIITEDDLDPGDSLQ